MTKPTNTLVNAVRVGDMVYVSGTGPMKADGKQWAGRLGQDMEVKDGQAAARDVGLRVLAALKAEVGSLDKVVRLVKTFGMVNCTPDFKQQPVVINGFMGLPAVVVGLAVLRSQMTTPEAVADTARATRQLARRQVKWFRRDPRVHWIPAGACALDHAMDHLRRTRAG